MKSKSMAKLEPAQVLRDAASRYPEAKEGIACAGTALEKRTIKVRNKAFLFLGARDVMFKVGPSLAEVSELSAKEPSRYKAGAHGWVTVTLGEAETLPLDCLLRWLDASHRLLAPKTLVASLPKAESY